LDRREMRRFNVDRQPRRVVAAMATVAAHAIAIARSAWCKYRIASPCCTRFMNGAHPAELPVEQPIKFDFVINLRTARVIGVTVPPALLARADGVIP
jgi:putative ABC transport system substrate-binding protein